MDVSPKKDSFEQIPSILISKPRTAAGRKEKKLLDESVERVKRNHLTRAVEPPSNLRLRKISSQFSSSLTKEIEKAVDARNLKIAARHTRVASGGPLVLRTFGLSKNPVTKLDVPFYIKKESIPSQTKAAKEPIEKIVLQRYQQCMRSIKGDQKAIMQQEVKNLYGPILQNLKKHKGSHLDHHIIDDAVKHFQNQLSLLIDNDELAKDQQNQLLTEIKSLIATFEKSKTTINIKDVPVRYHKQEVIDSLRYLLTEKNTELELLLDKIEKRKKSRSPLQQIRKRRGRTMSHKESKKLTTLSQILQTQSGNISKKITALNKEDLYLDKARIENLEADLLNNQLIKQPNDFLKHLTELVSTVDVMSSNSSDPRVRETLKQAAKRDLTSQSYAYKTGPDNQRELLAQKILESMGLDKFILTKTEQKLEKARLKGIQDPVGIAARWIEGKRFGVKFDDWNKWNKAKLYYQKQVAINAKPRIIKRAKDRLIIAEKHLLSEGGLESIAQHILIDAIFGAGDSHLNQYIVADDKQLYNCDWAQFMAPHPAYTKGDQTFLTLRSALLNHPISDHIMTDSSLRTHEILSSLRDRVLSLDVDEIVKGWHQDGLVGDKKFFEDAAKQLSGLETDYTIAKNESLDTTGLKFIADKYNIKVDPKISERDLRQKVIEGLRKRFDDKKTECYKKIHPDAVLQWQRRMKNMQHYLKDPSSPTLRGAWEAYYPEITPFLKILERVYESPTEALLLQYATSKEIEEGKEKCKQFHTEPKKNESSPVKKMQLRPELREKLKRAGLVARQKYRGVRKGARPMADVYIGELVDAKHRYGASIFPFWRVWFNTSEITDSFNGWMAKLERGEEIPGKDKLRQQNLLTDEGLPKSLSKVRYLTPQETKDYELQFNEKQEFQTNADGLLTTDPKHPHMFVFGPDGKFYVGKYEQGVFNHSSFLKGAPVLSAGRLFFNKGKLVGIEDNSGHYKPDDAMTLKGLKELHKILGDEGMKKIPFRFVLKKERNVTAFQVMTELDKIIKAKESLKILAKRPLEEIIFEAREKNLATDEEIDQMIKALEEIRKVCPTNRMARTSIEA